MVEDLNEKFTIYFNIYIYLKVSCDYIQFNK